MTDDTLPAQTLPADAAEPAPAEPQLRNWDRYELGDKLGEGGMGVVYQARDRRLDRTVAIKLIRGAHPALAMRLLREARAQARIDHPNVCRVYEVGEHEGRVYIALQLVAGEPLGKAAAQMSLDEKVSVMRDIALAIHEAHRLGIIHRDLKPANVLVDRADDGRWHAVVMDFGLAREATLEVGLTETGALLGTPSYMSPEQARGDVRAVDRRSDVYSLGATLYELLVDRPPFGAESLATALELVIDHDPIPPRKIAPAVPVDLETIALKCLAKAPADRYASARALADDLGRYLDGEPIAGRRTSLRRRLGRSIRRHRALYTLGAVSTVALGVVGAFGVSSYLDSRDERARSLGRAQLAEKLGREAKDLELFLRTTYQLPLHDTRRERDVVRKRMVAIAATPHTLGPLGDAMVHDALGRAHLALHEYPAALAEIDRAAKAGLDTPELHVARGRILGELYHRAYEEARRSGDKQWLAARQQELATQYLEPALAALVRGRGATDSALLDAFVALYQRDYATARTRALAVAEATPWLYESKKVAADALHGAAVVELDRGNYDVARKELDEANVLYGQAAEIARSDAAVHEASAQARFRRADLDYRQGTSKREVLDEARGFIERAIAAAPDIATAYTTKAYLLLLRGRTRIDAKDDVRLFDEVIATATRAVTLDPADASAWDALGNAQRMRGIHEAIHGGEGSPWWRQALTAFARALAIRPNDPWPHNDMAIAHRWLGEAIAETGGDPMPDFRAAVAGYQRATAIDPAYVFGWANQAELSATVAAFLVDRGDDPNAAIADTLRAGNAGIAIDASMTQILNPMARAELAGARFELEAGRDPSSAIARARTHLDRAAAVRKRYINTSVGYLRAARLEASWQQAHGLDASVALAIARASLAEASELDPDDAVVWLERADGALVTGELEPAARAADRAIELDKKSLAAKLVAADIELHRATHNRGAIARARDYLGPVLAITPRSPRVLRIRAALDALP